MYFVHVRFIKDSISISSDNNTVCPFQMKVILRNKTSIESWIEEKVNVSLISQFVL